MKTIIEDFDHIASRLNQIEQEKHTAIMQTNVEDATEYTWTHTFGGTPAVTIDDVYCV